MPTIDSPLRYPGGKTQLAPFVADLLKKNLLQKAVYAEPFAGGAGLAWRLLLNGHVGEVWLNDIDPRIFSFWDAVINHSDALCDRIEQATVTIEEWHRQQAILRSDEVQPLDRAFATLFMNRTNRSGILLGGVIGGKNQSGAYKLDCRFNKQELIRKIRRIALYRNVVKISQLDASECLQLWDETLPPRSLINIDPPYYIRGQELYINAYDSSDHENLSTIIKGLRHHWMLTYDDVPAIEELYSGFPVYRQDLTYYAQVKRRASELLVLSPSLRYYPAKAASELSAAA